MTTLRFIIIKYLLIASCLISKSAFAQISGEGIYIDGVLTEEIDCYTFGNLDAVIKMPNLNYPYYAFRETSLINFKVKTRKGYEDKQFPTNVNMDFSKNVISAKYYQDGYIVFPVFSSEQKTLYQYNVKSSIIRNEYESKTGQVGIRREQVAFLIPPTKGYLGNRDTSSGSTSGLFSITILGARQTGYEEVYDADCNCIKKYPTYEYEELKTISIKLSNIKHGACSFCKNNPELDYTIKCTSKNSGAKLLSKNNDVKNEATGNISIKGNNNSSSQSVNKKEVKNGPYSKTWENTGKIMEEGQYKDNKKTGTWKYYSKDGKLDRIEEYGPNEKTYKATFYSNDETEIKSFIDGAPSGEWSKYVKSTNITEITTYLNGQRHGKYSKIKGKDKPQETGTYSNGKKTGQWKSYHWDTGKLEDEGMYTDGEKDGVWIYYNDGKLFRKETYSKGNLIKEEKF